MTAVTKLSVNISNQKYNIDIEEHAKKNDKNNKNSK